MANSKSMITTDHSLIKSWVEQREGKPATVKGTSTTGEDPGLLRIFFPGYRKLDALNQIQWEEFFQKFDDKNLAFLFQEETSAGKESRFFKFVARTGPRAKENKVA